MPARHPPRFVPTLTEVVQVPAPAQGARPAAPAAASAPAAATGAAAAAPVALSPLAQEQLARRVLQRVDVMLDRRVREAIAAVVVEQTAALLPVLRERIEAVVRETVARAVEEELAARRKDARG